jgi:hypothetical protein
MGCVCLPFRSASVNSFWGLFVSGQLSELIPCKARLIWALATQEFQGHFPTLPGPVVHALLELYQQVLAHIEVHSKVSVGATPRSEVLCSNITAC